MVRFKRNAHEGVVFIRKIRNKLRLVSPPKEISAQHLDANGVNHHLKCDKGLEELNIAKTLFRNLIFSFRFDGFRAISRMSSKFRLYVAFLLGAFERNG